MWFTRASHPVMAGKLNLSVMAAAFSIFGLSLLFQAHRWESTPAYHVLLQIFTAQTWGALFLASGVALAAAAWQFERRWVVTAALMPAFALTNGWLLGFIARYLSSPNTTPETWVSWAVFDFLLLKAAGRELPRDIPAAETEEITAFRRAIDDALTAAETQQRIALAQAVNEGAGRLRDAVSAACAAYAQALHAIIPAGGMPGGDLAWEALKEAQNALLRAEGAFERSTGQQAPPKGGGNPGPPDGPPGPP